MSFSKYLKDRVIYYCIFLVSLVLSVIFLKAFKTERQAIVVVSFIFTAGALAQDMWNFFRKREFYKKIKESLTGLDKKYLLPETIQRPQFYEGKIMFDVLLNCSKSMSENVAFYRRQSKEFREFIEMWVHEAKLPLASLRLMCGNSSEINNKMSRQIARIDDDIENVLYYARSESPEKDYIVKEVMLQRAFSNVAVKNRDVLQMNNIQISTSDLNIPVLTDGKWLEFIIGQLMANSIKYKALNRQAVIKVSAENLKDKVIFNFYDNGIGIPEEDIPYVFEKSFTGQNGRKGQKSTGMGLYIVKKLCDRLGHAIKLHSVQNEYTLVTITFAKNDFYKMA